MPAGLVAEYKMVLPSGVSGKIQDHTINDNQGTIFNAVHDGIEGLYFDGTGDTAFGTDIEFTNLSVVVWVNVKTLPGASSFIASRWRALTEKRVWGLSVDSTGQLFVEIGSSDGQAGATQATVASVFTINTWYQVGFVFTDGVGVSAVYVDGVSKSFGDAQTYTALNQSETVLLSLGNDEGLNLGLDGWIRKFQMFNTALTALDFQMLYEQGAF